MKIAVIIEGSTKHRSGDVVKALSELGHDVINLGMQNIEGEADLTYLHTGLITALALNLKAVDFVVGGCGTGQGYMNAALQFPGTACGLLCDPVDAFLYSQVNAGNCVSLALNKGYGALGGDLNLKYLFKTLFENPFGGGYPPARVEIQQGAVARLAKLSLDAHLPMIDILKNMDQSLLDGALSFPGVMDFIKSAPESELKSFLLAR